nr:MAG TPA: hypothetical protein [Caudoviricetes sp.]
MKRFINLLNTIITIIWIIYNLKYFILLNSLINFYKLYIIYMTIKNFRR